MYDPPGSDSGFEWVEIVNDGTCVVSIKDIRFWEAGVRHFLKVVEGGSDTLGPGDVGVIVQDESVFLQEYPDYTGSLFRSSFSLRQQGGVGEELGVFDFVAGKISFSFIYIPDERASDTGATLHIDERGRNIPAPATPGEIGINPITVRNRKQGEGLKEREEYEEVVEEVGSKLLSQDELVQHIERMVLDSSEIPIAVSSPYAFGSVELGDRVVGLDARVLSQEKTNKLLGEIILEMREVTRVLNRIFFFFGVLIILLFFVVVIKVYEMWKGRKGSV